MKWAWFVLVALYVSGCASHTLRPMGEWETCEMVKKETNHEKDVTTRISAGRDGPR